MNVIKVLTEAWPLLLRGLGVTVVITAASLLIAFVIGMVNCLFGLSRVRILQLWSRFYLWIIRGTPLLVQVFIVYFGVPQLMQSLGAPVRLTPMVAGIITLSLNAGAYMSEIFRGGINAVDRGQMEAARSLGLPKWRAMRKVILPQAIRVVIPSLVNQFIITLKDTSLISSISLAEIVYEAKIYIGRTMQSFATWMLVGAMYLVIITLLSALSRAVERRMSNDH